jgi:hypothetical protein
MEKFKEDVLNTPQQHAVNSVIMEWAADIATTKTEQHCELKSIKCWENENDEEAEQRFTESAQEIFNEIYDEQMTDFYKFANEIAEAMEPKFKSGFYPLNEEDKNKVIDRTVYEPVHHYDEKTVEVCEEGEAEFWSVYVHFENGEQYCVADVETKQEAIEMAEFFERLMIVQATKVLVEVEGGLVRGIHTNREAKYVVVDYDDQSPDPTIVGQINTPDTVISADEYFYKELFSSPKLKAREVVAKAELKQLNF